MRNFNNVVVMLALAGCGGQVALISGEELETPETVKSEEAWSAQDNPSLFTTNLELRFDALPLQGEASNIPWAGSYWPTYEDNINYRWAGPNSDSASLKYQKAFGGTNVEDAVSRFHGIESVSKTCREATECDSFLGETCAKRPGKDEGRCVATWWGICHAWTPAAILFPEPKRPVTRNGVTFEVQDLKGLASLVHNSTTTKFVSLRCNKHSSMPDGGGIKLDAYGRPVEADRECRDTNAGTYHVLLGNYLGLMKQSFAEDRTADYEVWNQPLRGYKVTSQKEVTSEEANRLIGVTATDGGAPLSSYRFNPLAARFIQVKAEVKYISESSAEDGYTAPNINLYTRTDRYEYVLELDATGRIIGGEWVGSSKQHHPDFLWLPIRASGSVAGGAIKYDEVKAMVLESAGQGALVGAALEVNESATLAKGEWRHFGPFTAAAGAITVALTGTGDADLYVKLNGQPSLNLYDCRPYAGTANENCTAEGPGALYVSVHGYSAATVQLKVKYVGLAATDGGVRVDAGVAVDAGVRTDAGVVVDGGVRPDGGVVVDGGVRPDAGVVADGGVRPDAGVTTDAGVMVDGGVRPDAGVVTDGGVAHLSVNGSVALGELKLFSLPVTAGRLVVIRSVAAADVDLYLKLGAPPTTTSYVARAYTSSGNETLRFTPTSSGVLYIGVHGYRASTFSMTTADQ
ncbi:MAG: pre-peptidase C-terminal domain-containing protein [Archangium sp.]|nr:pre-peptidase C-terminal domain-containing protein [Archangium sp.]